MKRRDVRIDRGSLESTYLILDAISPIPADFTTQPQIYVVLS